MEKYKSARPIVLNYDNDLEPFPYAVSILKTLVAPINKNDTSLIGEVIIINDNSSDNTDEIVSQYKSQNSKIRYFKTKFLSLNKSYNFAVTKSKF